MHRFSRAFFTVFIRLCPYLNIILQPRSLAAAERIEATDSSAELALLVLLDNVEGLAGLAAVFVKHHGTGTSHRSLGCLVIIVNYTVVNKIKRPLK